MQVVEVLGTRICDIGLAELLDRVSTAAFQRERLTVGYVNAHVMDTAAREPKLAGFLDRADIVYCDGWGPVLAARITGKRLGPRMTGADWILDLCSVAAAEALPMGLVASEPGVADKAARVLEGRYPGLSFSFVFHGFFKKSGSENDRVIREITRWDPRILLVGMGTPLQEQWIMDNREALGDRVVWAVGAMADYVSGKLKRAPEWMLEAKLEWLFRLCQEPGRLSSRYIRGNARLLKRLLFSL